MDTPSGTKSVAGAVRPVMFKFLEYGILGTILLILLVGIGGAAYLFVPRWLKSYDLHDAQALENTKALREITDAMKKMTAEESKCVELAASADSLRKARR